MFSLIDGGNTAEPLLQRSEVTCGGKRRTPAARRHGASVEDSDPSPAPAASVTNPAVAVRGL